MPLLFGHSVLEGKNIISNLVRDETGKCLEFASQNPEISLLGELSDIRCEGVEFVLLKKADLSPTTQGALLALLLVW